MKELIKSIARPAIRKYVAASEKRAYSGDDIENVTIVNEAISNILKRSQPASIGKMGGFELNMARRYLRDIPVTSGSWTSGMHKLHVNAGIFPEDTQLVKEYCAAFLEALKAMDVLAVYYNSGEAKIVRKQCPNACYANPNGVEPFSCDNPWSQDLKGKNVLVIYPFKDSIRMQYEKRELIWGERKLLPDFNLMQIKMPLSNALVPSEFKNWKELLDDIKRQMDAFEYDVAIVGAGAYSLLITEHAKMSGKIGIHIGGAVQILFGVYGSRWLSNPGSLRHFNEHWIRPFPEETPPTSKLVENACYW